MNDLKEVPIRTAATTMLVRDGDQLEVLMVKRNQKIDFYSGAMMFPGGKVEQQDCDPEWAEHAAGWNDVPETERGPRIAAIREAFEECGVIPTADLAALDPVETAQSRAAVDSGELPFIAFMRSKKARLDLTALTLFSRWLTPPVVPKRFDTFFYVVRMPHGQTIAHDGRETVENEWVAPAEALRRAENGERTIFFPTRMNLRRLARSDDLEQAVEDAATRSRHQVLPTVVMRDGKRFIQLNEADGYGKVEEPLQLG